MYDIKYAPYSQYLGMAHGDGYQHLKRWLKNRLIFTDTLFDYAPSYNNDMLTIRANTTELMTIEIETYTPVYQHVSWYNGQMDKIKIDGKTAVTFTGMAQTATDQEVLIYGGTNIKRIRGISSMNPNTMLIGSATRLVELEVKDCPILTDINSNKANLSPHTYLNKLDLSNCPQLGGTLRLNNSPLIQEVNVMGTAITDVQMPTSIRNLEILRLPKGITTLTLNDAPLLNTLEFEDGINLQSISMTNCDTLENVTNFDITKTPTVLLDNSYDTEELYMSETTDLTLKNMSKLERVIYLPNDEYETFELDHLTSGKDYSVTTFNCPKLTDFITTAPHRLSYNNGDYGDIKPNITFTANSLDLSNTQFTNIKFLCTTDLYQLKLPSTLKNFYCDSAFDIDSEVITDASYTVIHDELIEPYTTNYEGEVYRYYEEVITTKLKDISIPGRLMPSDSGDGDGGSTDSHVMTDYIPTKPSSTITFDFSNENVIKCYDKNKVYIQGSMAKDNDVLSYTVPSNAYYFRAGQWIHGNTTITYTKAVYETPNIIPSSASGSLIFNMYSNNTTQPTSTSPYMWDLTGLKLNDFYTFGMNNWVKYENNTYTINCMMADRYSTITDYNTSLATRWATTFIPSSLYGVFTNIDIPNYSNYKIWQLNEDDTMTNIYTTPTTDYFLVQFYLGSEATADTMQGKTFKLGENLFYLNIVDVTTENLISKTGCIEKFNPISITMPQRLPGYSVRMVNADITPNNYATHLYPLLVDTTLPITGKLDYTKYNGTTLAWAYAYTTSDVDITALGSQQQGGITNDYNKLYGTTFIDIVDVWAYKDDDFSSKSTNENIRKAYIELTSDNYKTRIDEVLQWYPNCTDLYFFEDGSVSTLETMFSDGANNYIYKTQIQNITFIEGYFTNLINLYYTFRGCSGLKTVNNIPNTVQSMQRTFSTCTSLENITNISTSATDLRYCFYTCKLFNQQLDLSECTSIISGGLSYAFQNCSSLECTPILPSNYTGSMVNCFDGCSKLVEAPVIPDGVTNLQSCFYNCTSLTTIGNIPSSCNNFYAMVQLCSSLTSVPVDGWHGNMYFTFDGCTLLNQQINIESATSLEYTFRNCTSLAITPNLPEIATCIMRNTFYNCGALVTPPITPEGVTDMNSCYDGCSSLTTAPYIPDSVTDIGYCLQRCSKLTNVTLPLNNTTIYIGCIQSCTNLTDITWKGSRNSDFSLSTLGGSRSYTQEDVKELVPEHLDDLYKDTIKLNCNNTKVTINDNEVIYIESVRYVEYIQGDGINYINTGIYATDQWKHEIVLEDTTTNNYESFFGDNNQCKMIRYGNNGGRFQVFYNNNNNTVIDIDITNKCTIVYNKNIISLNDTVVQTFDESENTDLHDYPMMLFLTRNGNQLDNVGNMKLYSFKMWDGDGTLQFDGRPCLVNEKHPCIYDEVSKKFFFPQLK